MKYKITPYQSTKPTMYVITSDATIIWADRGLPGWVGRPIRDLLDWVSDKQIGRWSVVDQDCRAPRVTYSPADETME